MLYSSKNHYICGGLYMSENKIPKNGRKSPADIIFRDNSYCWCSALCTAGIMMLVMFCFNIWPFGDVTILRMDLYHQYGPLFAELYDRITGFKSFLYSWQTGMGSSFIGNYFNYLSSPSAIIMLLLGHKNMPEAIAGMIIAKACFSAGTFTYYLKESQHRNDFTTAAFGVLYSMSGWFIAYYWNVMWIDAMVFFPLVILGIEKIISSYKPGLYIFALTAALFTSYYMGYMTCIFSVLYFLTYFIANFDFLDCDADIPFATDASGKKTYRIKDRIRYSKLLKSGCTFAFASLICGLIASCALIPVYFVLKNCSATSGTFPEEWSSFFTIYDFISNHIASLDPTIRSSGDEVLPNIYCGIATLMLLPFYLFSKKITMKHKAAHVILIAVIYFSFSLNKLSYIWHGFHFPNDLPYRFSFMYSFILLILAYRALNHLKEFTGKEILGVAFAIIGAIIIFQKFGAKNVSDTSVFVSIAFVVTYCLVFVVMKNPAYNKSAVSVLLLCCIIGEYACANTGNYSMSQPKKSYTSDYADFRELKNELDEYSDNEFYRMELTYNRARMDPAWYGYNGISTFTSMAYEKLANLQDRLGLNGNFINSYTYYLQTPVYNMMMGLRYVVNNDPEVKVETDLYNEMMTKGKFTAYENKYTLPIAFGVNKKVKEWFTTYENKFEVQNEWVDFATGVSDVMEKINIEDVQYFNVDEITSGIDTGEIYYNKTNSGESGQLTFVLKPQENKHAYLFVNSTSFDNIEININNYPVSQNVNDPYIYDIGIIKPDDDVLITCYIDEDHNYGNIYFFPFSVNYEKLDKAYDILEKSAMEITSFEETDIKGTIKLGKDQMIYTSIPYDKGWNVYIDGEKANDKIFALQDALLAINADAGEHEIEFKFVPQGMYYGFIGTTLGILLLLAWLIFKRKLKEYREISRIKTRAELAGEEEIDSEAIGQNVAPSAEETPEEIGMDFTDYAPPEVTEEPIEDETEAAAELAEAPAPAETDEESSTDLAESKDVPEDEASVGNAEEE